MYTTVQKWALIFLNKIYTFIERCHKLFKCDSKDIYNVTKYFYLNKCCSFELSINHRIQKKCINVSKTH